MPSMEKQIVQKAEIQQSHHSKQVKTLWMLVCHTEENDAHQLVPFYARCAEDAEQQVQQWLSELPRCMVRISLRSFPAGFAICRQRLRGTGV